MVNLENTINKLDNKLDEVKIFGIVPNNFFAKVKYSMLILTSL
jgi:hypothetical protein